MMMTNTLRRRMLHHGNPDRKRHESLYERTHLDGLNEPLLGRRDHTDWISEERGSDDGLDDDNGTEQLHWSLVFSQVIAQWSQWIADIVRGSKSLIERLLPLASALQIGSSEGLVTPPPLSPLQEERLRNLQRRVQVPFDGSKAEHQDALRQLWKLAYPTTDLPSLKSELWKEMGWQGSDPSTDFRGGGFISLENLIYFAETYPESFQRLLHKRNGTRAEWEYPFAIAGINISFMLTQALSLQSGKRCNSAGIRFLELLEKTETAFDDVYCIAFQILDAQWLAKRASYMEFNDVLKSTRAQLEHELKLQGVSSVRDLPTYTMLRRS